MSELQVDAKPRPGADCPYCRDTLGDAAKGHWTCASCAATQHVDCWSEAGGVCAACGTVDGHRTGGAPDPPTEAELEALLASEGHGAVVAAFRAQGLSEPESLERAVALATRVEVRRRDATTSPLTWVLFAQAAALGVCALLAAFTEAQAAVIGGALALAAPLPFLLLAGWKQSSFGWSVALALLNVAMAGVGAGLVDALDVRRRRPSAALCVVALIYVGLTVALALWSRRPADGGSR